MAGDDVPAPGAIGGPAVTYRERLQEGRGMRQGHLSARYAELGAPGSC
ncbi:hypothetical protein ACFTWH_06465 [Streptomyces sp. NPDC057011]